MSNPTVRHPLSNRHLDKGEALRLVVFYPATRLNVRESWEAGGPLNLAQSVVPGTNPLEQGSCFASPTAWPVHMHFSFHLSCNFFFLSVLFSFFGMVSKQKLKERRCVIKRGAAENVFSFFFFTLFFQVTPEFLPGVTFNKRAVW